MEVLEIVVTASRISTGLYPSVGSYLEWWTTAPVPSIIDPEWTYQPYSELLTDYTSPNDPKKMVIEATIADFLDKYADFRANVDALSDNQVISVGGGFTISGAELKAKVAALSVVVTGKTYAPGYAGANYGDRFEIDYRALGRYNGFGQQGINYLVLHEISHNTVTGLASRSFQLNKHRDAVESGLNPGPYQLGNQYFEAQESYANSLARAMSVTSGIDIFPPNADPATFPPFGFIPGF